MKMNKFIFAVVFLFICLTACVKQQYIRGQIDDEAERSAQEYWKTAFEKCGEFYFGGYSVQGSMPGTNRLIYAIKDPIFLTIHKMDNKVLTEADKLNQFEWQGTTFVIAKATRYYSEGKWKDWVDGSATLPFKLTNLDVRKIHGKWEFGQENADRFLAIPCEQVPSF
jgi:hypothetical protein